MTKKIFVKIFQGIDVAQLEVQIAQFIQDNSESDLNYIEFNVSVATGAPVTTIMLIGEYW